MLIVEENGLTQTEITAIVTQYMLGQGWRLVGPTVLAERVWHDIQVKNLYTAITVDKVKTMAWQQYAIILHDICCSSNDDEQYQLAWSEFRVWLNKNVYQVTPHPQEQEDVVQETLIELQAQLRQNGLRNPRSLWAYALQMQRRKQIDLHRKRSAKKRGADKIISLEAVGADEDGESDWEEKLAIRTEDLVAIQNGAAKKRSTENEMADQEINDKLHAFFQRYLPTDLQREVAAAIFLDGLAPKEVAVLIDKKPHEIRLLKARIVKQLRTMPAEQKRELLQILDMVGEVDNDA